MSECLANAIVCADSDRLTQVMTNLISNAVKFSPSGETVLVGPHLKRALFRFVSLITALAFRPSFRIASFKNSRRLMRRTRGFAVEPASG